jgi:hypothetical protein
MTDQQFCRLDVDIHDGFDETGFSPTEWLQIVEPDGTVHEVHRTETVGWGDVVEVMDEDEERTWKLVDAKADHWQEVV